MPTLRELEKMLPQFVQFVPHGRNGQAYRRFFVRSPLYPEYFHCYMQAEDRLNGLLPVEYETLELYAMNDIRLNEATISYEASKAYSVKARWVTYSAPDNTQVARMRLLS